MGKKIGAVTFGTALLACGAFATDAHAADVKPEDDIHIESENHGDIKFSDVNQAKGDLDKSVSKVNSVKHEKAETFKQIESKKVAKSEVESKLKEIKNTGSQIEKENTKKALLNVKKTEYENKVTNIKSEQKEISDKLDKKSKVIAEKEQVIKTKEQNVASINNEIKQVESGKVDTIVQKGNVAKAEQDVNTVNREIKEKEAELLKLKNAEQNRVSALQKLNSEKDANEKRIMDLGRNKEEVTKELKDLKIKIDDVNSKFGVSGLVTKVKFNPDFVSNLKDYLANPDKNKLEKLISMDGKLINSFLLHESWDDVYKNTEKVDIEHLSEHDSILFSEYFALLNNQIREQFGMPPQRVNLNTQKFFNDVARKTMADDFSKSEHYHRALNEMALKYGIDKEDQGDLYNRFESQDYTLVKKSEGKQLSKKYVYDAIYRSLIRFYHEGHMTGHYGHAKHLLNDAETLAVGLAVTSDDDAGQWGFNQLKISVASVHKWVHHNRAEWRDKFSGLSHANIDLIDVAEDANLKHDYDKLVVKRDLIERDINELNIKNKKIVNSIVLNSKPIDFGGVERSISLLKSKREVLVNKLDVEKSKLNEVLDGIDKGDALIHELSKKRNEVNDELKILQKDLVKSKGELDTLRKDFVKVDLRLTEAQSMLDDVLGQLLESESKIKKLKDLATTEGDVSSELSKLDDEITELKEKYEKFDNVIHELELQVDELTTKYNKAKLAYDSQEVVSAVVMKNLVLEVPEYDLSLLNLKPKSLEEVVKKIDGATGFVPAEDKKPEDKKPEDKKPEDKKPETNTVSEVIKDDGAIIKSDVKKFEEEKVNGKTGIQVVKSDVKKLPNTGSNDSGVLLGLGAIFTGLILRRKVKGNK